MFTECRGFSSRVHEVFGKRDYVTTMLKKKLSLKWASYEIAENNSLFFVKLG